MSLLGLHRARRGAALGIALTVTGLSAQQPPAAPPPQPSSQSQTEAAPPPRQQPPFRSQANLVRVDAYATHDGVPVQDLTADDFEVLEDGKPQKIDSFEHIVVRPALTTADLSEPNSTRASLQAAADPHRRVFVVYLDKEHSDVADSHNIKEPLIDLLTRVLGPDDLVGIMTSGMSPSDITFGRRTEVIEEGLRRNWTWGRRNTIIPDETEAKYERCYPPVGTEQNPSPLASALIKRRRERMVLESVVDLVRYLSAIREGRTAVITISNGWVLYRPDDSLTTLRVVDPNTGAKEPVPGMPPPVGIGRGGTLTTHAAGGDPYSDIQYECDRDRMSLAMLDDDRYFRDLVGDANHSNVSFYTIDPRGLAVFDSAMGPEAPPPMSVDLSNLNIRQDTLRVLAANTDGLALLNNNDLKKQMRRIADDLTSYYLLGYYSTNAKPDGKFRTIKVRAKRPGIEIRARSGYRAATVEELAAARPATDAVASSRDAALTSALGQLELSGRGTRRRAAGAPAVFHRGPSTGNQLQPASAMVFSRTERLRLEMEATGADTWSAVLLDRTGKPLPVPIANGDRTEAATQQRWLTADLSLAPLGAGDYVIELTTKRGAEPEKTLLAIRVTQ